MLKIPSNANHCVPIFKTKYPKLFAWIYTIPICGIRRAFAVRAVSRRTTNAYGGQNTIELSTIHFKFFVLFFPLICTYLRQSWKRVLLRQFHFEYIYCCGSICFVLAVRCPMPSSQSRPHALRVFFRFGLSAVGSFLISVIWVLPLAILTNANEMYYVCVFGCWRTSNWRI